MDLSDLQGLEAIDIGDDGLPDGRAADPSGERGTVSLREFLAANYIGLHRRLRRHLGCTDLASDCLHDAWLRLGETALPAAVGYPEAYVYRMACNLALDRLRSSRRRQALTDLADFDHIVDRAPGPDLIAEGRSDLAAVERAMQRLPGRHRSILLALRVHGMTREEVGRRIDLSPRRVDTVLRQALDHCAEHVGRPATASVGPLRKPSQQASRVRR